MNVVAIRNGPVYRLQQNQSGPATRNCSVSIRVKRPAAAIGRKNAALFKDVSILG